jgi:hypothetical protein
MKSTTKEKDSTPIHSLIRDRKLAFANLIRAYLKFNVPHAEKVDVVQSENNDVYLAINDNLFKLDISDYTGLKDDMGYIFFNPSSGRLLLENKNVKKIYKLDVDLVDNNA